MQARLGLPQDQLLGTDAIMAEATRSGRSSTDVVLALEAYAISDSEFQRANLYVLIALCISMPR